MENLNQKIFYTFSLPFSLHVFAYELCKFYFFILYRCANTSRHTQIWTQSVQLSTFSHQRAKVKQEISITRSSSCVLVFECIFFSFFFLLLLLMLAGYGWYKYRIVHFFFIIYFYVSLISLTPNEIRSKQDLTVAVTMVSLIDE